MKFTFVFLGRPIHSQFTEIFSCLYCVAKVCLLNKQTALEPSAIGAAYTWNKNNLYTVSSLPDNFKTYLYRGQNYIALAVTFCNISNLIVEMFQCFVLRYKKDWNQDVSGYCVQVQNRSNEQGPHQFLTNWSLNSCTIKKYWYHLSKSSLNDT